MSAVATSKAGPRAGVVLLSLALLVALTLITFQIAIVRMPTEVFFGFGAGVPAMVPLVCLLLLALAAPLPLFRRFRLTRSEVLLVYIVLLVGVPLASRGVLFYLLPKVTWYHYMAALQPGWESRIAQYIPSWWGPTDPQVLEGFLYGGARVPWSVWALPLAAWGSVAFSLWACVSCILVLFRHQWIQHERLTFPVAQIPLEILRPDDTGADRVRIAAGARGLFWLGVGIGFIVTFVHSISARIPEIPYIPLVFVLMQAHTVGPLAGIGEIRLAVPPFLLGLFYLLPKEILFSAWFLWIVHLGLNVAAIAAGFDPQQGSAQQRFLPAEYQGLGAAIALTFWLCWIGRRHLLGVLRRALSLPRSPEDARDAAAYRAALIIGALSFAWMAYFAFISGCRPFVALVFVALVVGYYVLWARVRAETGLGFLSYPVDIAFAMTAPVGSAFYRPREIVTFMTMRWATFIGGGETLEICTGGVIESYKIGDSAGINWRTLSLVIAAGFAVALVGGILIMMTGLYRVGILGTDAGTGFFWPALYSRRDGDLIYSAISNPAPADGGSSLVAAVFGAFVAIALGALRLRFWWWPLHPIGYLLTTSYGMIFMLFPFFIAWVAKALVMRYAGLRLYRATLPLVVGIITGDLLNVAIWSVVSQFSTTHGPMEWWW